MQSGTEKNTASKEKIRQVICIAYCPKCDRNIPIYYNHTGFCPICKTKLQAEDTLSVERIEKYGRT